MAKKWLVHRNDQSFGPWSAAQIREELRKGTVDPFDLVNMEGSPVMRELVEIDEIFYSEDLEYSEVTSPSHGTQSVMLEETPPPTDTNTGSFLALAVPNVENSVSRNKQKPRSKSPPKKDESFISRITGKEKEQPRSLRPKSEGNISYEIAKKGMGTGQGSKSADAKKYFLIDGKGRIFGPKSAGEIQSMFYRGLLGSDVSVKKDQSEIAVPIGKFVEVYAHAKKGSKKAPPVIGNSPRHQGGNVGRQGSLQFIGTQAVTSVRLLRSSRNLTIVSILILVISVGIGIYAYQTANMANQSNMSSRVVIEKNTRIKSSGKHKNKKNRLKPKNLIKKKEPAAKPAPKPKPKPKPTPKVTQTRIPPRNSGGSGTLARPGRGGRQKFNFEKRPAAQLGTK